MVVVAEVMRNVDEVAVAEVMSKVGDVMVVIAEVIRKVAEAMVVNTEAMVVVVESMMQLLLKPWWQLLTSW